MCEHFDSWLVERLFQIKERGLYRTLNVMNSSPSSEMNINGETKLVFSSNNYLGLANDQRLIYAAETVLHEYGTGSSGSRLTTGNTLWHERLENKIANFKQTEGALLFSSGFLANVGVLSSLPTREDVILSDQYNHASIIDGCRLSIAKTMIYKHVDMRDLEIKLKETKSYQRRFIVTDGVFSMDGNIAPLDEIMTLAKEYNAFLIVDDAHATGVLGERGRGTSEYFNVKPDVIIGTLSKAVGAEGGYVAGSKLLIEFLINQARTFIFQTAMSPSSCAAAYMALEIIETEQQLRDSLMLKVEFIKSSLEELGYVVKGGQTPIIPIIIGDEAEAMRFSKRLLEKGIFAPAIRPPTVPTGESRIRLTVTSLHTMEELIKLIKAFDEIGREMVII